MDLVVNAWANATFVATLLPVYGAALVKEVSASKTMATSMLDSKVLVHVLVIRCEAMFSPQKIVKKIKILKSLSAVLSRTHSANSLFRPHPGLYC